MTATQYATPVTGEAPGSVEPGDLLDPEARRRLAQDMVGGLLVHALAESGLGISTDDPRLLAAAIALMQDVVDVSQIAARDLFALQRELPEA